MELAVECSIGPVHGVLLVDSMFDDYRVDQMDDVERLESDFVVVFEVGEAEIRSIGTRRKG